MISGDLILLALFTVTGINIIRYLSTLKTLLFVMREAHPLLYQQVDGRGFSPLMEILVSRPNYFIIYGKKSISIIMIRSLYLNVRKLVIYLCYLVRYWLLVLRCFS